MSVVKNNVLSSHELFVSEKTYSVKSSLPTQCKFQPPFICMTFEVKERCGYTDQLEGGGELSKVFTLHTEEPSCT
jgi:hypothetical protein